MALKNTMTLMADSGGTDDKKTAPGPSAAKIAQVEANARAIAAQDALPAAAAAPTTVKQSAGGGGAAAAASTAPSMPSVPSALQANTDATRALYDQSLKALEAAEQGRPEWTGSPYDADIDKLYAQITGRGDFSYDLKKDALWQQYRDDYQRMGKAAMEDTMGRAAGLTGGYGSSYAQGVGQQAYDQYLTQLGDIAPELYDRAYQRWSDKGDALVSQLGLARGLAGDEYEKYTDRLNQWLTERGYAKEKSEDAYSKLLTERSYGDSKEADNLSKVQALIAMGYTPTAQEIADAGLTPAQYSAIAAQYAPKKSSSGGGGGSTEEKSSDPFYGMSKEEWLELRKEYLAALKGNAASGSGVKQSGSIRAETK